MADEPEDSNDELDNDEGSGGGGLAAWLLPFGTSFVALAVGALVGGLVVWLIPREPKTVEVPRELTAEEKAAACEPEVSEAATDLEEAEVKLRGLEAQVAAKQEEIVALEAEMERRGTKSRELATELEEAKRALSILETELDRAITEKEALVVELRKTQVALDEQVGKTEMAIDEGNVFKWRAFIGLAQLQICEKGQRRKMGRCRETVAASLEGPIRTAFEHCLRSGQETPTLHEVTNGSALPLYAQWLYEEDRVTKGWYVRLCDPTLPEATAFGAVDMDKATEAVGGAE